MTILELCEPLFLKICQLNRMARLGQSQDYQEVRAEIKALLEEIQQKAGADAKVAAQAKKLELPLMCFVDSMIGSSHLQFAGKWQDNRLAVESYNELAGANRFFEILDETIEDASDEASERLAVFYTCLGLGLVGELVTEPERLRGYMGRIAPRIRPLMDVQVNNRLCPDGYAMVDTRNLIQPPSNRLVFVVILFVFLCLSTLVAYIALYVTATNQLATSIDTIATHGSVR